MKIIKIVVIPVVCFLALNFYIRCYVIPTQNKQTARHISSINFIKNLKNIESIDYLILGDSTCLHNYIAKEVSANTYAACISGGNLMDAYKSLTQLDLSKITKGVVVSNTFNTNTHYNEDFWKRTVLARTYSLSELSEMYDVSASAHFFPSSDYGKGEFMIRALRTQYFFNHYAYEVLAKHIKSMQIKDLSLYLDKQLFKNQGFVPMAMSKREIIIPDDEFFETYQKYFSRPFIIDQTDLYYFNKIEKLVSDKNLKLVIAEPTQADIATDRSAKEFKETYKAFFNNLMKGKQNYFYYEQKTKFTRKDFFDYTHLHYAAVERSTESLRLFLNKLK